MLLLAQLLMPLATPISLVLVLGPGSTPHQPLDVIFYFNIFRNALVVAAGWQLSAASKQSSIKSCCFPHFAIRILCVLLMFAANRG